MENFVLSAQLINAIAQYLGNRPYVEVVNIVAALQQEINNQQTVKTVDTPQE